MTKPRWNYLKNKHGNWCFDICYEYPNCNHDKHYVIEVNKRKKKEAGQK